MSTAERSTLNNSVRYETIARFRKADAIATVVLGAYATLDNPTVSCAEAAEAMSFEERVRAAVAARQNVPSEATWALVVEIIRNREAR